MVEDKELGWFGAKLWDSTRDQRRNQLGVEEAVRQTCHV